MRPRMAWTGCWPDRSCSAGYRGLYPTAHNEVAAYPGGSNENVTELLNTMNANLVVMSGSGSANWPRSVTTDLCRRVAPHAAVAGAVRDAALTARRRRRSKSNVSTVRRCSSRRTAAPPHGRSSTFSTPERAAMRVSDRQLQRRRPPARLSVSGPLSPLICADMSSTSDAVRSRFRHTCGITPVDLICGIDQSPLRTIIRSNSSTQSEDTWRDRQFRGGLLNYARPFFLLDCRAAEIFTSAQAWRPFRCLDIGGPGSERYDPYRENVVAPMKSICSISTGPGSCR